MCICNNKSVELTFSNTNSYSKGNVKYLIRPDNCIEIKEDRTQYILVYIVIKGHLPVG